ncbi:hypothetical protein CONPUDRAFT_147450 [Coniophora puteana RWD-64-598 SS2]|uniref:Protein-S-isoprenylcysteine O-methyltransferase n=1 Tax=Coniophora puteana (strain RWD-64-598) TaxID=741705 RepID=A0A5M3M601_CONPW|nr:uncharacterized protein CONPUDRAFT_147450 [Coniophora puteana RWD-64-598 SS2]EIW74812.1 hypothetical protein CONPUDRAFT_147450 [Coniophora puteana RWD-64-598 SS2]
MSWLKLGLFVSSALGNGISASNPNPNPPKEALEQVKRTTGDMVMGRFMGQTLAVVAVIPTLAEAAITVALKYPSSTSSRVLDFLGYDPSRCSTELSGTFLTGAALATLGGIGRCWCYRTLGQYFTFQLTLYRDHHLITSGPYAVVRHPSYTFVLMICTGIAVVHGAPGSWLRSAAAFAPLRYAIMLVCSSIILVSWKFMLQRLPLEDEYLRRHFGREWEAWASRVRYWLVPGII